MMTLPTTREISDGMATPATPILRPNTHIAFPSTLIMFIRAETLKVTAEFPMARKSAAPEL